MRITEADKKFLKADIEVLKAPELDSPPAQRLPEVIETVSKMLSEIEKNGIDAVKKYSRDLDKWDKDFELSAADLAKTGDKLSPELETRKHLVDFELETTPGVVLGQKYIPIERVGAYLPAGNFPILSSAFMTVGVSKVAGVPMTMACTPPMSATGGNDAVLYSAYLSGVDRTFILGGVQALAAMTFGLLGEKPVDILVGAGNAYVAEAKRQLFGRVGIDCRCPHGCLRPIRSGRTWHAVTCITCNHFARTWYGSN
jgi:sulfopropanediol 3-dehydrogenase